MKVIIPSYISEDNDTENIVSHSYFVNADKEVETMVRIESPLPVEKRIFDEIDTKDISMQRVHDFIDAFTNALRLTDLGDITLTPMHFTQNEDGSCELEWIYNYFRLYYSFEPTGDDTFGLVENNTDTRTFKSTFTPMREGNYLSIAYESLNYVINHIQNSGIS